MTTMIRSSTASSADWTIIPRNIDLDWSNVPLKWIYDDAFASSLVNNLANILVDGEFSMCRAINEALPYIQNEKLREDAKNFVKQEALHARAHQHQLDYLKRNGITDTATAQRSKFLMEKVLSAKPFGIKLPKFAEKRWLITRLGVFATLEHFTTLFSVYKLNQSKWDENGCDPTISTIFTWHSIEEIEHRTVVFDVYQALGGDLPTRIALMSVFSPMMLSLLLTGTAEINRLDPNADHGLKQLWKLGFWQAYQHSSTVDNLPSLSFLLKNTLKFLHPAYNPIHEGCTEQARMHLEKMHNVSVVGAKS